MKKTVIVISAIVIVITSLYVACIYVCNKLNSEAEITIEKYSIMANEFESRNGRYPDSIDIFVVPRERVLYIFKPVEIIFTNSEAPEIWYAQLPLGPLHVYNLVKQEWSYAE